MDLFRRRVIVVGLGESGIAAARLCLQLGATEVIATDRVSWDGLPQAARSLPVEFRLGGHEDVPFSEADLVVVSPGVPFLAELRAAEAKGVEVIGELELASRCIGAPVLCVGGTNGKSTTTVLLASLLAAGGHRVFAGGNLGLPLSTAVGDAFDYLVVEVSSFQLERAPSFRPAVSLLLNLSPDHLDRYPDFAAYAQAKGNAFVNQNPTDVAIVPHGEPACLAQATRGRGKVVTFGPGGSFEAVGEGVQERETGAQFSLVGTELRGAHNALNAAAAIAAARAVGVDGTAIAAGLSRFRALPHRMALVREVRGVRFYDDSKGTNVGASVTALLGLREPRAVLIAGGRDKLGSYAELVRALEQKGRAVVLIGEAQDRIAEAVGQRLPTERAETMIDAVERAFQLARPGDAVLLSPACSSFDMFRSYADRGEQFVAAVGQLGARLEAGGVG